MVRDQREFNDIVRRLGENDPTLASVNFEDWNLTAQDLQNLVLSF